MSPYALSEVRMTNRNQRPNRTAEEAYFMLVSPPNSAWPKQLSLRLSTIKPGTSRGRYNVYIHGKVNSLPSAGKAQSVYARTRKERSEEGTWKPTEGSTRCQ